MNTIRTFACCILIAGAAQAAQPVRWSVTDLAPSCISKGGDDAAWEKAPFLPARPLAPRRDDILGDQYQAGNTYYDYQTNGDIGKMIAVDSDGGVHVTWMDGYTNVNTGERHQVYNYLPSVDDQWIDANGIIGPVGDRSGYGSIWLSNEAHQRALLFCHTTNQLADPALVTGVACIDLGQGFGAFNIFQLPRWPDTGLLWPQGVLSPGNRFHIVGNASNAHTIGYTTALYNNGRPEFPEQPTVVTPTDLNCYRIACSPTSERAAIIWTKFRYGDPAPAGWAHDPPYIAYDENNDLWLATTNDGTHWNFDNPYNVTQCIPPNPDLEAPEGRGDTLRPGYTFDLIFDSNDYIHIVFQAWGLWEKPHWQQGDDGLPWDGITLDASYLFHWSEEDSLITPVADGWFSQEFINEQQDTLYPRPGGWKANVCYPSLGYDGHGNLYCAYNYYPYGDFNDYVATEGRCNGDIAVTVSRNNGRSWYYPTMVVQTPSPLAIAGDAMCEIYPTLNQKVDDNLHIFYILDREAGSSVGGDNPATNTQNPCYYLRVPVDRIAQDSIWQGPHFHVGEAGAKVSDGPLFTPAGFKLAGAYPNPFNNQTEISYELQRAQEIELGVYGLDGRLVRRLFAGRMEAGAHKVAFAGDGLAAGIYLVRLKGEGEARAVKVAMVK